MPKRMEEVRITAPVDGTCPVCAVAHDAQEPHDISSLYYQNRFYKAHRRFPTWADAMRHCRAEKKAVWTDRLKSAAIEAETPQEERDGT